MAGTRIISREDVTKAADGGITYTSDKDKIGTDRNYKHVVLWKVVLYFIVVHIIAAYGFLLLFTGTYKFYTLIWVFILTELGSYGITIGAHRYYTHKTFKAKPPLRAIFIALQTLGGQYSMYNWCRTHRLHHRFSDTDADPHNAERGFFYSHIGWLMTKRHPFVTIYGKQIDMSDLEADWMVMFQKKYYLPLYFVVAMVIPISVPVYYFGETWKNAILLCYFTRYICSLNGTFLVNSAAHKYGTKPYDASIASVESWFVSLITSGEGWHNYHHAFPWDYKAAELPMLFNSSAKIIRFFEFIGLAWDLKSADPEMVKNRISRTGDGTHYQSGDEKRPDVTAIGFLHPLNPSYTTVKKSPELL